MLSLGPVDTRDCVKMSLRNAHNGDFDITIEIANLWKPVNVNQTAKFLSIMIIYTKTIHMFTQGNCFLTVKMNYKKA